VVDRYVGVRGIAEALGVSRHAVHKWRSRYPAGSSHPFPEPDVDVDGFPGWWPDRLDEIREWRAGMPGQGAGGGRPATWMRDYLTMAASRGLAEDEALRALSAFGHEYPDWTESQVAAWLIEQWRGD
jgi:hypothetical protein